MNANDAVLLAEARKALVDGRARTVREEAGLTQAEVGRACGVTSQAVHRWESGGRQPRGEFALRYARLLARLGLQPEKESA